MSIGPDTVAAGRHGAAFEVAGIGSLTGASFPVPNSTSLCGLTRRGVEFLDPGEAVFDSASRVVLATDVPVVAI